MMNFEQTIQSKFKDMKKILAGVFSMLLLIGIAVCGICDLAITHTFTWSLYPISSIVFAWLVFIPAIRFGKKGICGSLISCSVFIAPFLYVLNKLINTSSLFLPVSLSMAAVGVAFLWITFILFKILRARKLLAAALTILLLIPANVLISFVLSKLTSEVLVDMWDIMDFSIAVIAAVLLIIADLLVQKRNAK